MNKVLFLDVDGVLNNGEWAFNMHRQGVHVYSDDLLYEPSLEQLRRDRTHDRRAYRCIFCLASDPHMLSASAGMAGQVLYDVHGLCQLCCGELHLTGFHAHEQES